VWRVDIRRGNPPRGGATNQPKPTNPTQPNPPKNDEAGVRSKMPWRVTLRSYMPQPPRVTFGVLFMLVANCISSIPHICSLTFAITRCTPLPTLSPPVSVPWAASKNSCTARWGANQGPDRRDAAVVVVAAAAVGGEEGWSGCTWGTGVT